MYTDWKNYFKPYMPAEEYIPDNTTSKNLSGMVFFIALGILVSLGLVTKVEGKSNLNTAGDPVSLKIQKIKNDIKVLEIKNAILESDILILNHSLTQTLENKEKQQVLKLSKLTGTNKVIAPGIIVKISDNDKPLQPGENPNLGIIHNTDLLEIVNDLWSKGAKAISINDQRITSLSDITCVGPAILVNKTRIVSPFIIKAAGNPDELNQGIEKGHAQTLKSYGIKYLLEKYERIEIPANGTIILSGDF